MVFFKGLTPIKTVANISQTWFPSQASKSLACFLHMVVSLVLFAGFSLTVALSKDCEMVGFSPKYSIMKKFLNCCEVENYHLDSAIHALVYFFYHIADHVLAYLSF